MKITLFLFLVQLQLCAMTQGFQDDLNLIKGKEEYPAEGAKPLKGLLKIYQKTVSEQILNDCIYDHSCSSFSQGAVNEYGIIKGLVLTGDRLMRCNRASTVNVAPIRFTNEGKIKDHWSSYSRRP